jgi:hypothetical protein
MEAIAPSLSSARIAFRAGAACNDAASSWEQSRSALLQCNTLSRRPNVTRGYSTEPKSILGCSPDRESVRFRLREDSLGIGDDEDAVRLLSKAAIGKLVGR